MRVKRSAVSVTSVMAFVCGCSASQTEAVGASSGGSSNPGGGSAMGSAAALGGSSSLVHGGASASSSQDHGSTSGGFGVSSTSGGRDGSATGGTNGSSSYGGNTLGTTRALGGSGGAVVAKGGSSANAGGRSNGGGGGAIQGGSNNPGGSLGKGGAATGGTPGPVGSAGQNAAGSYSKGGAGQGGTTAGNSAASTCSGSGWNLIWSDEFNGESGTGVDPKNWTFDLGSENGGWGNNELEYYTKDAENVSMDGNGNLVISAIKESQGGKQYTSARMKTQGLRAWRYGRIEGRMQIPKGQGIWPAFWMLGTDIASNAWPNCGEIDIMENVGKEPTIVHGSLHGPGYSGGSPLTGQVTLSEPVGNAFHVFAIEWDATSIRWYVDNTLFSTKKSTDVPSGATWVYTHEFFLILNLAVGGTWPGAPDDSIFPQRLVVDYIRVCQK